MPRDAKKRIRVEAPSDHEIDQHQLSVARLLTVKDVAAYCQVSEKTVRRAIDDGRLVATRPGNSVRIRPDDLEDWLGGTHARAIVGAAELGRRRSAPPRPDGLRALLED